MGQIRGDLQTDIAITFVRARVYRRHDIGRHLDIAHGQVLVERLGVHVVVAFEGLQRLVVISTAGDRLLKNRRVGCHPHETIIGDETSELARGDQTASNVIVPDALSVLLDVEQWIRHD